MSRNERSAEGLDGEYRQGRWRFLGDVQEMSRHGVIASWLTATGSLHSVLDVGCGAGHFYRRIAPLGLSRYVGVDLSAEALAEAREVVDPSHASLVHADLGAFSPAAGETFSAVVFNEVLSYASDPAAEVRRYAAFLAPGGVIALSIYAPARAASGAHGQIRSVWSATDGAGWTVLDDVSLRSEAKGVSWRMRLVGVTGH